ncbi:MAG: helix-turn-helix transcriptional regulator [Butyricicoccus sp.]
MSEQEKRIFAENLRQLRARTGMTQKDFAKKAGITPATLSAYEAGQKSPAVHIAAQIAKIFGSSLDWLCGLSVRDTVEDNTPATPDLKTILKDLAYFMREPTLSSIRLIPSEMCWEDTIASINIKDSNIYSYLNTIQSLVTLNRDGTLDDDMFHACVESAIKKTLERIESDEGVPF